jgi:hypothetical protein
MHITLQKTTKLFCELVIVSLNRPIFDAALAGVSESRDKQCHKEMMNNGRRAPPHRKTTKTTNLPHRTRCRCRSCGGACTCRQRDSRLQAASNTVVRQRAAQWVPSNVQASMLLNRKNSNFLSALRHCRISGPAIRWRRNGEKKNDITALHQQRRTLADESTAGREELRVRDELVLQPQDTAHSRTAT